MQRTLMAQDYAAKLKADCRNDLRSFARTEHGDLYRKDRSHIDLLTGPNGCELALKHAAAFVMTGDETFREFANTCLIVAEEGLIEHRGHRFWANEITPSLCTHGRWIRQAYYAARAVGNEPALSWMADVLDRWPYDHDAHRFVERLLAGPQRPTSVGGFSHTYNMVAEGAVDGWMLGHATGNKALMARCEDVIIRFILPGQRDDGHWDYRAHAETMAPQDSCLPEEYNYSFYTTVILSNLLAFPVWQEQICTYVVRSFEALRAQFENEDGSIYAPVHWGPGHLFESTLFSAVVAWRLARYAEMPQYEPVAARAIHWKEVVRFDKERCPLYWDRHFLELLVDDFCVTGLLASTEEIISTLEGCEAALSTPLASHMQYGRWHSSDRPLMLGMQRKIHHLKRGAQALPKAELRIPSSPVWSEPLHETWEPEPGILSYNARFAWDTDDLHADITVANNAPWQPYHGFDLFRGDGVLLRFFPAGADHEIRISLALTDSGERVAFLYNSLLPLGGVRSWLPENLSEGTFLKAAALEITKSKGTLRYTVRLPWRELGITPTPEARVRTSLTITKLQTEGFQHLSWGSDPFDSFVSDEPGILVLGK